MSSRNSLFLLLLMIILPIFADSAHAQNLIKNGDFNATSTDWATSCVNVECYGFETTYGGPSGTNHVAEIDDEACMHQDACVLPGATYVFSMDASRRTGGGPDPCICHIKIMGLDASSTIIGTYVDMDFTRTNAAFALTPVTGIPVVNVPASGGVVYLRVELTDNTPGYLTLGMIVDNLSLVMTSAPAVTPTGSSVVTCQNTAVPFSVTGLDTTGLTFSWDFGPDATPATSTSPEPSVSWSTAGSKTVKVILGNGVCFPDTLTYNVTVTAALHFNIFDTTCPHTPFVWHGGTYTATGTYNDTLINPTGCDTIYSLYLYVRPPIVTNFYHNMCQGDSFTFDSHIYTATGVYADTFLTPLGCDSISVLNLLVNPIPPPPSVSAVSYCQYEMTVPLVVTGTGLVWYGPGVTAPFTATPAVTTTNAGTITYYITQTVLGCTSDSAMLVITVKPKPLSPVPHDTAYCQYGTAVPLQATGMNIQWYPDATSTTPSVVAPVPVTTVAGTFTWYASQTVNGCESDKTPVNVRVVITPEFTIAALKTLVCLHDILTLQYSGPPYATYYFWDFGHTDSIVNGSPTTAAIDMKFNTPGKRTIYLNVIGPEGMCTARDTIIIDVDTPGVASVNTPGLVCLGDTVGLNLGYRSPNAATYTWQIDGNPLSTSTDVNIVYHNSNTGGPFNIAWTSPGLHIITLNVVSIAGCRSPDFFDTVQVSKLPDPSFTFVGKNGTLCLEDSILFKAAETGSEYQYVWTPANYFKITNTSDAWGKVNEYLADVTLTVSNPLGCKASKTMQLNPQGCCKIFLPNAFTPGPGKPNSVFRPVDEGFHRFHEFRISNRWGETVFQTANDNAPWDGSFNGVPQDAGVYYYYLKYDCNGSTKVMKGDVTLIR